MESLEKFPSLRSSEREQKLGSPQKLGGLHADNAQSRSQTSSSLSSYSLFLPVSRQVLLCRTKSVPSPCGPSEPEFPRRQSPSSRKCLQSFVLISHKTGPRSLLKLGFRHQLRAVIKNGISFLIQLLPLNVFSSESAATFQRNIQWKENRTCQDLNLTLSGLAARAKEHSETGYVFKKRKKKKSFC